MKVIGKYLIRILFFLTIISSLLFLHFENLESFFLTNQTLNSVILIVIGSGIIFVIKQLINIKNELSGLNNVFKLSSGSKLSVRSPKRSK